MQISLNDKIGLLLAYSVALNSTCPRRQVGAVITNIQGKALAIGHNHSPIGRNCLDTPCPGAKLPRGDKTTAAGVCASNVHAEVHALMGLGKRADSFSAHTLYVTCPPCSVCIKFLVYSTIEHIVVTDQMLDRDDSKATWENLGRSWATIEMQGFHDEFTFLAALQQMDRKTIASVPKELL